MTGRLISDELERLDLLLENKRILQEKHEFTVKRLKALENLCLQMGKVPTVENGFVLLLTGQGDLRRAMMQKKMVCGKLVEKFGDYQALREEVFDYSTKYNYNKLKENLYQAIVFCRKRIFGRKKLFYFPKIVLMDTQLIENELCGSQFEKNQTVQKFFQIMHVGMKRSKAARQKIEWENS